MYEREARRREEHDAAPAAPAVQREPTSTTVLAPPAPVSKERPTAERTQLAEMVLGWQRSAGNRAVAALAQGWKQEEQSDDGASGEITPASPEAAPSATTELPGAALEAVAKADGAAARATAPSSLEAVVQVGPLRPAPSSLESLRSVGPLSPAAARPDGPAAEVGPGPTETAEGGVAGGIADSVATGTGEGPPDGAGSPTAAGERDDPLGSSERPAEGQEPQDGGLLQWLGSLMETTPSVRNGDVGRRAVVQPPPGEGSPPIPATEPAEPTGPEPVPGPDLQPAARPAIAAPAPSPAIAAAPPAPSTITPGFREKGRSAPGAKQAGGAGDGAIPAKAPASKAPAGKHRASKGGPKAAAGRGGGGGGGGAPAKPALHDPTLEKWRAASSAAVAATPAGDLGEAKDGPKAVADKGKEVDADRKAGEPDFEADAKAKQPPMPTEPKKDEYLDTAPADAAVTKVKEVGERKLSTQTLTAIGAPPPYEGLNPRDYVPKTKLDAIAELEKKLEGIDLAPGEREKLTAELEKRKADVAAIEERAKKGSPAEAPPSVVDKGPASLEPPDPAKADLLGDAIANLLARSDAEAGKVVKKAVAALKGQAVSKLLDAAKAEEPNVKSELDRELRGIAEAAGVTEEQLKSKVDEEKLAIKKEAEAVDKDVQASSVEATKQVEGGAKERGEKIAGAKEALDKEVQKKQQAVDGPPDTAAIERKRDEYVTKIQQAGAQAAAGVRASLETRGRELDAAGSTQKQAAKAAADNQAAAIRRKWAEDDDKTKGAVESLPTNDWGRKRMADVDAEVRKLKADAKKESDAIAAAVSSQVTDSKESVRDWAARQEGRERSWWDKLIDRIRDWGTQATANNDAWEKQRNAESRDQMKSATSTRCHPA
jgi:hypothetical protein